MPPAQCPECGRFLKKDFVQGLVTEPAHCPKCETVLSAAQFPDELGESDDIGGIAEEPAAAAELREDAPEATTQQSAPPVLADEPPGRDPLEGWDQGDGRVVDLDRYRDGQGGPPPDAAILAGAAGFGAVVGALSTQRRARGALLGAGIGALAAAVARRLWVLDA